MNNTYSNTFNLKYSNGIKKTNSLKISKEMEKTFDKSIPIKIKKLYISQHKDFNIKNIKFNNYISKLKKKFQEHNENNKYFKKLTDKYVKYKNDPKMTVLDYINKIEYPFSEIITQYRNIKYKIPTLTTDHNLFNINPLLVTNKKINQFFHQKIGQKNINLEEDEKNVIYMNKLRRYLKERIEKIYENKKDKKITIKNFYGSCIDDEYEFKIKKEEYKKKFEKRNTMKRWLFETYEKNIQSKEKEDINQNFKAKSLTSTDLEISKNKRKNEIKILQKDNENILNLIHECERNNKKKTNTINSTKNKINLNFNFFNNPLSSKNVRNKIGMTGKSSKHLYRFSFFNEIEKMYNKKDNSKNLDNDYIIEHNNLKSNLYSSNNSTINKTNETEATIEGNSNIFNNIYFKKKLFSLKKSIRKKKVKFLDKIDLDEKLFKTQVDESDDPKKLLEEIFETGITLKNLNHNKEFLKKYEKYLILINKIDKKNINLNDIKMESKDFLNYIYHLKFDIEKFDVYETFKKSFLNENVYDNKKYILNKVMNLDNQINSFDKDYIKSINGILIVRKTIDNE